MTYTPNKGFSLVETMVAVTILAVALIGPFLAVNNALRASYVARDQLVASMLAQEAMEYVRSIRDNNYLASPQRHWLNGFDAAPRNGCFGQAPDDVCVVDPTRGDFHADSSGMSEASPSSVPPLRLSSGNLYNQQPVDSGNVATKFVRTVVIETIGAPSTATEARVTVTVTWSTAGQTYTTVVEDVLTDWL